MAGATRLHVRRRGVAAITAIWLVVCGVLAVRHEAITPHVVDRSGAIVHAPVLLSQHTTPDADVHGRTHSEADHGDCAVLTAFHHAASARVTAPALVAAVHTPCPFDAPRASPSAATAALYRLAPKTSPPQA